VGIEEWRDQCFAEQRAEPWLINDLSVGTREWTGCVAAASRTGQPMQMMTRVCLNDSWTFLYEQD
jgi:hypothetical protein